MFVTDRLWSQLLQFREDCGSNAADEFAACWNPSGFRFCDRIDQDTIGDADVAITGRRADIAGWAEVELLENELWLYSAPQCDVDSADALRLYVPLCVAPLVKPSDSFVMVHMAQSLDGRVSTSSGQSKWIGNAENLAHAHRLRALVDGVLVGGNTARQDLPGLNVRQVSGPNPARIILSNTFGEVRKLPYVEGMRTIIVRYGDRQDAEGTAPGSEILCCESLHGQASIGGLLADLRRAGIFSILIEGGPLTFASFLRAGTVNCLQIHVAPIVFGSGMPLVTLPSIKNVDEALALRNPFYTILDDAIMVTAQL